MGQSSTSSCLVKGDTRHIPERQEALIKVTGTTQDPVHTGAGTPPEAFVSELKRAGVTFYAGVPDSLLKEFNAALSSMVPTTHHVIAANEGSAVGIAAGYHLATGEIPLVYMQNSGLGNAINPLASLTDPEVYALPLVLLIGWRGEPGVPDEPQHAKQGRVSPALLDTMEIPYRILGDEPEATCAAAAWAARMARERGGPTALLARKGAFGGSGSAKRNDATDVDTEWTREAAIAAIADMLPPSATVVATTGHIARELYEHRRRRHEEPGRDFLTVGSMGHASQIALGLTLGGAAEPVVCLDGDGAALMHLGGLGTIGSCAPRGLVHVVLNNGVHDSVGAQPTVGLDVSLTEIARACGYASPQGPVTRITELDAALEQALEAAGPGFLEVRVRPGARAELGRPQETPAQNRTAFMRRLGLPRT